MRAAVVTVAAAFLLGCSPNHPSLPVYDHVPPFVLTAQTGQTFDSAQMLNGKVWVADFIFTSCMGPCPRLTQTMRWVQKQTSGIPDVHFVSFTVDPKNDTPPALAEYARRFGADTANWTFLTGPMDALHKVGRHSLKVNEIEGELSHSTRFVLVDRRGNIRGYYDTGAEGELDKLVAAIRELAREPN